MITWTRIAALGAVLTVLLLVFEVGPRFGEAFDLYREWRALRARLEAAETAPAERARLSTENDRLRQEREDLLVQLPRRDQLSVLLGEIQRYASEAGVTLHRIQPGEPVSERTHEVLPVRLEVTSSYHGVGRFVDRIERSPLLMQVRGVQLSALPEGPGTVEAVVDVEAARLVAETRSSR